MEFKKINLQSQKEKFFIDVSDLVRVGRFQNYLESQNVK